MAHINVRKLSGNELGRELVFCDDDGKNDEQRKLRVLKNKHTNKRFKVYDPNKILLKEDVYFEKAGDAEEFMRDLIFNKKK